MTNQNAGFAYIKLSVAGKTENGRKKNGFDYTESQFPLAGIRLFFKIDFPTWFPLAEKNLQINYTVSSRQKIDFH